MTKPNLTLYGIETQLLELLNFRDAVSDDPDLRPDEQAESLKAIDQQIQAYVTAEVKKADGIAGYLREFETRAEALKQEAKRCSQMAKDWETRRDKLESMVIGVMRIAGVTRIDGRHSVLQLKRNPPSVEVAQPELVPENLRRITVTLSEAMWMKLSEHIQPEEYDQVAEGNPEPMKGEISKRLKSGDGVPGCRLRTDGVRLEVR